MWQLRWNEKRREGTKVVSFEKERKEEDEGEESSSHLTSPQRLLILLDMRNVERKSDLFLLR